MRFFFPLRLAAASLAALIGAAAGAQEQPATYSEEQVSDFVDLLLTAAEIENTRVADVEAAPSPDEAQQISIAAEEEILHAIETSALPLDVYDDMVVHARTDIRLAMQIYDELESRGEVAQLPEPESAFEVIEERGLFEAGF